MNRLRLLLLCWCFALPSHGANGYYPEWLGDGYFLGEVSDLIQYVVTLAQSSPGQPSMHRNLYGYYLSRQFRPIWVTPNGVRGDPATLLDIVERQAAEHGLVASDYRVKELRQLLSYSKHDAARAARLDMLLTDTLMRYARDMRKGRVEPYRLGTSWRMPREREDYGAILLEQLQAGTIARWLQELPPPHPGYRGLLAAYRVYRQIEEQGGWPQIESGAILRRGDQSPRVLQLRGRLGLESRGEQAATFDRAVESSLRDFQRRHGLPQHGILDKQTLDALNVDVGARIDQILINLMRWRWMPHDMPDRYLLINMAGYDLRLIEEGQTRMWMKVIIGKDYRQTPVFSSEVEAVVINPYWYVPRSILVKDLLPLVKSNPDVLNSMRMEVFADFSENARLVDPKQVDWSKAESGPFPYVLRQKAGPDNALGRFKFVIKNGRGIYLHDTNKRTLFDRSVRAFSSGCIRLEKPEQLALTMLGGQDGWNREAVEAQLESGTPKRITLEQPMPVYFIYLTAWVDESGTIHFRDDVYGRDNILLQALQRRRLARQG